MIITTTKKIGSLRAADLFKFIVDALDAAQTDRYYMELTADTDKAAYIKDKVKNMLRNRYKVSTEQLATINTNTAWEACVPTMVTSYETDLAHKNDPIDVE